jgi:hypothetical protein
VVADAVAKAVRARRPRTRYAVGRGAWTFLAARALLPDRALDRLMALVLAAMARIAARSARHRRGGAATDTT